MNRSQYLVAVLLMVLPINIMGVPPIHTKVSIDSSIYERNTSIPKYFVPGPFTSWKFDPNGSQYNEALTSSMIVIALLKKNSNQIDMYSFNGKIGTSVVPNVRDPGIYIMIFSCNVIDGDDGWESIIGYINIDLGSSFKVFDDDGTELLADSGLASYGFDGNSTYVIRYKPNSYQFDTWRFRTNISAESPKTLAKTKSIQQSPMQIFGLPGGDYRVTLTPSSGNQINFQMFDLLGRCVFDKQIENLNRPVTFTVPEGNVPNSPFIAKVNDGNNTIVKKQIPVK